MEAILELPANASGVDFASAIATLADPSSKQQEIAVSEDTAPLADLMLQLEEARQDPNEDDLQPTPQAEQRTILLLSAAARELPQGGSLYRDGDGGLRIEWEHGDRQIRLIVHASQEREDYLYWQEGTGYNIATPVTSLMLIAWLRWLREVK